jgi:hypothetical protein
MKTSLIITRETEKAIQVEIMAEVEFVPNGGYTSSMVKYRTYNLKIWLPKSQVKDGVPSQWITSMKENDLKEDSWLNSQILNGRVGSVTINYKYNA